MYGVVFILLYFGLLFGRVCFLNCFALLCVLDFVYDDALENVVGVCRNHSIAGWSAGMGSLFPKSGVDLLIESEVLAV